MRDHPEIARGQPVDPLLIGLQRMPRHHRVQKSRSAQPRGAEHDGPPGGADRGDVADRPVGAHDHHPGLGGDPADKGELGEAMERGIGGRQAMGRQPAAVDDAQMQPVCGRAESLGRAAPPAAAGHVDIGPGMGLDTKFEKVGVFVISAAGTVGRDPSQGRARDRRRARSACAGLQAPAATAVAP